MVGNGGVLMPSAFKSAFRTLPRAAGSSRCDDTTRPYHHRRWIHHVLPNPDHLGVDQPDDGQGATVPIEFLVRTDVDLETGKTIDDPLIAWRTLGCLLISEQEETVFSLCVRFPLKAAIFGRILLKCILDISDFRQTARYQFFLDKAKFIDFSASKVGLDALKKLPDQNSTIEKLIGFLCEQDLLKSILEKSRPE